MDRLEAMKVFVTVADLQGFAPAARRLKLSPPSVTRLVAGLERHLGTQLLRRTTRSVTLTDSGARYLERARRVVADVGEAEDAVQQERTVPSGRFVVTAPNTFGRLHVGPLICRYLERYPSVAGELMLTDRAVNLVEDGVDVAVRIGALEDSSLHARRVGETRRVIVASPGYLARSPKLRTPVDLSKHQVVQFTAVTPTPGWRFADGRVARFNPSLVTNSADAAIGHVERGGGLAMVLGYQVVEAVRAGRLQVVLPRLEPAPLPIHVLYPSTRLLSAKVRAFIDLLTESCDWRFVEL
jgi:DNA-binding transcriptional LysR family regulator